MLYLCSVNKTCTSVCECVHVYAHAHTCRKVELKDYKQYQAGTCVEETKSWLEFSHNEPLSDLMCTSEH